MQWAKGSSILDSFTDQTILSWYLNCVEKIVTRVNALTGIAYKDDPAIFAWDLINEPHAPGDDSGKLLTVCQYYASTSPFTRKQMLCTLDDGS